MRTTWVKICGVTSSEDARMVARLRPDAIGLNFVEASPRCVDEVRARAIVDEIRRESGSAVEVVAVVADRELEDLVRLVSEVGVDSVQLHGHESPAFLESLLAREVRAYRAVRIAAAEDVEHARVFSGQRLLVDAKVAGALGGTGHQFDWALIEELNRERQLVLAGGLRPDNVKEAVRKVRPFGVDTASGVESAVGKKDAEAVRAFIERARPASSSRSSK